MISTRLSICFSEKVQIFSKLQENSKLLKTPEHLLVERLILFLKKVLKRIFV